MAAERPAGAFDRDVLLRLTADRYWRRAYR